MSTIHRITIDDAEYPSVLREIHTPPKVLYVNGSLVPEDAIAVALVGSRRASPYGLQTCEQLAFELAGSGITVVSGMARGIDTAAHRGALRAKGRTIAVMGSGHNRLYPPENKKLYQAISESGAVITEFEDDVPPLAENFPRRNRIISGLSLGVVVVEATKDSGALITANFALEQGREVFAVPGKVDSPTSRGTNELINQGARLVQSAADIIEELRIAPRRSPGVAEGGTNGGPRLAGNEEKVFALMSSEPMNADEILDKMDGVSAQELSKTLLSLELKKVIARLPGDQYIRKGETT